MQDGQFAKNTPFEERLASVQKDWTNTSVGYTPIDDPVSTLTKKMNNALNQMPDATAPNIISPKAIDATGRYPKQILGWNNEDLYGDAQSGARQAWNGVLKGLNLAGTTFLQGTVGMVIGLENMITGGGLNSLYNNDFSNAIEQWNKSVENFLPNYYTQRETDARWYEPKNIFSANFIFDKFVKNLGFSIGALYSGAAVTKALKLVPLINNAFTGGKATQALMSVEQELAAVPALARTQKMYDVLRRTSDAALSAVKVGRTAERAVVSTLGAVTEGGIEALQGLNEYRNTLIEEYVNNNGVDPEGADLDRINDYANQLGNARFGLNIGLLTATNYVMLPKILGSSYKTSKAISNQSINNVVKNAEGKFVTAFSQAPKAQKFVERAANIGNLFFSPTEGFEEISQYAIERGVNDYYNKAYRGEGKDFIKSLGIGYSEAINSDEGMEQFLIGALSGGIQQSGLISTKGFAKSGNIAERGFRGQGGERGKATTDFLTRINDPKNQAKFKSDTWLKDMTAAAARGINLQEEGDAFIRQGDVLEAKDNEADYMHNYLAVRIKHGRYDLVKDDIEQFRQQGSTEDGLRELKDQNIANENDTSITFTQRLENFSRHADNINSLYQSLNLTYGAVVDKAGGKVYSEEVIDKMVYAASKVADYDQRIPELNKELANKGIMVAPVLEGIIENNVISEKATKEALEQINSLNTISEVKDQLKSQLRDVIELSKRRQFYIKEYDSIKNNPNSYKQKYQEPREETAIIKQRNEEGKPVKTEVEIGKEYSVESEPLFRKGNTIAVNPKLTILSKTLGGEYEVRTPDGVTRYMSPNALKDMQLVESNENSKELDNIVTNTIYNTLVDEGYKAAIDIDTPLQGLVDFVNTLNSNVLVNKIQANIRENTEKIVEKIEKEKAEAAKLKKDEELKKQLEEQQKSTKSGIETNNELSSKELSDKDAANDYAKAPLPAFLSKEADFYDEQDPKPHQKRRLSFLNTLATTFGSQKAAKIKVAVISANNEASLGITGLIDAIRKDMVTTLSVSAKRDTYLDKDGKIKPEYDPLVKLYIIETKDGIRPVDVDGHPIENPGGMDAGAVVFQEGVFGVFHSYIKGTYEFGPKEGQANYSGKFLPTDVVDINTQFRAWRDKVLADPKPPIYSIKGVSRGVVIRDAENKPVLSTSLVEEQDLDKEGIITIPTVANQITINDISYNFPVGQPLIVNGANVDFLNNRKFTPEEAQDIYQLFRQYVDLSLQKKKDEAGRIKNYLSAVLYMGAPRENQAPSTAQIYYQREGDFFNIHFGPTIITSFTIPALESKKAEIIAYLSDYYVKVNNKILTENAALGFEQVYMENGQPQFKQYSSYSRFLLSPEKGTPYLQTKTRRSVNKEDPSIIHRYTTLAATEFAFQPIVRKEEAPKTTTGTTEVPLFGGTAPTAGTTRTTPSKFGFKSLTDEEKRQIQLEADKKNQAAFEAQKKAQTEAFKNKKPSIDNDEFSVLDPNLDYNPIDVQKELDYIKAKSPFNTEVLENIISLPDGVYAWGKYKNMLISFYKGALEGTGYHELFEGIWSAFTTPKQKAAILTEFRGRKGSFGFFDGKDYTTVNYKDATDFQAKETLANEFADYVLTRGESPTFTLGQKISNWFKSLWNMLKSIFTGEITTIDSLFEKIDAGEFKSASPLYTSNNPEYSFADLSYGDQYSTIKGVTLEVMKQVLNPNNPDSVSLTEFEESDVPISKYYDAVFKRLQEIFEEDIYTDEMGLSDILKESYANYWQNIKDSWEDVKTLTNEYLRTFSIVEGIEDENTGEIKRTDREDYSNRDYIDDRKYFMNDAKNTASRSIRLLFATLPESILTATGVKSKRTSTNLMEEQINYSKTFNNVLSHLSTYNSYKEKMAKLEELSEKDANIKRLYMRLTAPSNTANPDSVLNDWKLKVRFYQTMAKQEPTAWIQYNQADGTSVTQTANLESSKKVIVQSWIDSMKMQATTNTNPKYSISVKGELIVRTKGFKFDITTAKDKIDFLSQLGINFTEEMYQSLNKPLKDKFNTSVAGLAHQLGKKDHYILENSRSLESIGNLEGIAEAWIKSGNDFETTFYNLEGERQTTFISTNAVSRYVNDINNAESKEDLLKRMPHLANVTDSLYLETQFFTTKGERNSFKPEVGYIQGTLSDKQKPIPISKLSLPERLNQEINQNLSSRYYVLVPADSKTQWLLTMKNLVSYNIVAAKSNDYEERVRTLFSTYYESEQAEYARIKDQIGEAQAKKRFGIFKEISENYTLTDEEFYTKIGQFFNGQIRAQEAMLKSLNIISLNKDKTTYSWKGLDGDFAKKNNINPKSIEAGTIINILTFRTINYAINNVEMHKLFFGSPLAYKDAKRYKLFLSPREMSIYGVEDFNHYLNTHMNEAQGHVLKNNLLGKWKFSDNINTIMFSDVNTFNEVLGKLSPKYKETVATDAQAWSTIVASRERRLKNGSWFNKDEEQFQYSQALDRQLMLDDKVLNNSSYPKELQARDAAIVRKGNPNSTYIYVEKPILSGHTDINGTSSAIVDKFSIASFSYAAIRDTNFRDHYIKMLKQQIGYAIAASGRKVGQTEANKMYNEDGTVNDSPYKGVTPVPFSAFGVQTDTSNKKESQTRGTQITKLIIVNLYNNGEPINEAAHKLAQENINLLREQTEIGYRRLLKRIGAEDVNGRYRIVDKTKIVNLVKDELLRREVADAIKKLIDVDPKTKDLKVPFEALPNYIQIKNILYSYVDKHITHPKVNGAPKVQVSGALMEAYGVKRETVKGKDIYTSSGLKFYTKEEPWMEVMLPAWAFQRLRSQGLKWNTPEELYNLFKNSPDSKQLLSVVGFRIPTQEINSIENIRIAGFLPEEFGDTIIVPEEITTKAGSDFDIDKLNTYLQNFYVDAKGDIRAVPYFGIGEDAIFKIRKHFKEDEIVKMFKLSAKDRIQAYTQEQDEIQDDNPEEEEERIQDLYKQSIENEYYRNMQALLALPENFERLVTPNTSDTLKDIRDQLVALSDVFDSSLNPSIISPVYMLKTRHEGVTIKDLVGIAAISQTGTAVSQLSKVTIDPAKIKNLSYKEQSYLPNRAQPLLPHNHVDGKATISSIKDIEGNYITDNNSQFINGTVDVFNDAFLAQLNYSRKTAAVFHLMVRLGIPNSTEHPVISFFMNQPIIRKYLERLEVYGKNYLLDDKVIAETRRLFISPKSVYAFPTALNELTDNLRDNIKDYYNREEISNEQKAQQQLVFTEFLKYATLANNLLRLQQGTNYDTARMNDSNSLYFKEYQYDQAKYNSVFSDADTYVNNTFIGGQKRTLTQVSGTLSDVFPVQNEVVQEYLRDILAKIAPKFISLEDKNKIARKLEQSLFDYLIQTKTGANNSLKQMLVDAETAVANKLREFKKIGKTDTDTIWGNTILQNLIPSIRGRTPKSTKNVTLAVKPRDVFSKNLYNRAFEELYTNAKTHDFARTLIKLNFLQSGVAASRLSYRDSMPPAIYAATINSIMDDLLTPSVLEEFINSGAFYKNNWNNEDVVGEISSDDFPISGFKPFANFITHLKENGSIPKDARPPSIVWVTGFNSFAPFLTHIDYVEDGEDVIQVKRLLQRMEDGMGNSVSAEIEDEEDPSIRRKASLFVQVSAWGDAERAQEYYESSRTSVFQNGYSHPIVNINPVEAYNYIKHGVANEAPIVERPPTTEKAPTPVDDSKRIQDIINQSSLEKDEYVIEEIDGQKEVIITKNIPNKIFGNSIKFYTGTTTGAVIERWGKPIVIPGFEDLTVMIEQGTKAAYELTTGLSFGAQSKSEAAVIKELEEKFKKYNIRTLIADKKKDTERVNKMTFEEFKKSLKKKDCK